ncbi:MAG: acyl-CoA dehydrogenase family protein [Gammaproteobacteria bacterium]|nr:acyl-CoA dehydrogenase family protein [Gammaproteobacteria bacterium]
MAKKLTIEFSEEQAMMLDTATAFCSEKSPVAKVRALLETDAGFDAEIWSEIAGLGWQGLAIPEEFGGSGLGLAELVPIIEPMGRHLMASPLVPTTLAAQALITAGTAEQKQRWLPLISAGSAIGTLGLNESHGDWDLTNLICEASIADGQIILTGEKYFVADAAVADFILVSVRLDGNPALVLLDRAAIEQGSLTREVIIDETRRCYRFDLTGISVAASCLLDVEKTMASLDLITRASWLLLSAEIAGGIAGVMDVMIEYLTTRKQFGRYIGAYQALKHPMAEILCQYEYSRSQLYYAASIFDTDKEAEIALRMSKAQGSDTFAHAGDRAIQFHGGFGFTYECDAQLYLRRANWCQYQYGDAHHHRRKLADLLL